MLDSLHNTMTVTVSLIPNGWIVSLRSRESKTLYAYLRDIMVMDQPYISFILPHNIAILR